MRSGEAIQIESRFGLVFPELLGSSYSAAVKALQRSGLRSYPLPGGRKYWARKHLGPNRLPVAYAFACWCLLGDIRREPIGESGLSASGELLCFNGTGVEAVRVDQGGTPDHLARKAERFAARNAGRDLSTLTYVFLTATPTKAEAISRSLAPRELPFKATVADIRGLEELIPHVTGGRS